MESIKLVVEKRTPGKKIAKQSRANGFLPIEIYGPAVESNISGAVVHKEIIKALRTEFGKNIVVDLVVEGKTVKAIPHMIQINPVKNNVQHIDFLAINENEDIQIMVPVVKTGRSKGEVLGGKVFIVMKEVKVACKPNNIPTAITVDVTGYEIGTRLSITELPYPEGVTPIFVQNSPVIVLNKGRGQTAEEEAAAAAPAAAKAAPKAAPKAAAAAPKAAAPAKKK